MTTAHKTAQSFDLFALGEPRVEYVSDLASLDNAERIETALVVVSRPARTPTRRFVRSHAQSPEAIAIAIDDATDPNHRRNVGSAAFVVSESGNSAVVEAALDTKDVRGRHLELIAALERRARLAGAPSLAVRTNSPATRLALVEAGFDIIDKPQMVEGLLALVGEQVAQAMNFYSLVERDPVVACAYWREGCERVTQQLGKALGLDETALVFDERRGRAVANVEADTRFSVACREAPLYALAKVRIAGGADSARLPGDKPLVGPYENVASDHLLAHVGFVAMKELTGNRAVDIQAVSDSALSVAESLLTPRLPWTGARKS